MLGTIHSASAVIPKVRPVRVEANSLKIEILEEDDSMGEPM